MTDASIGGDQGSQILANAFSQPSQEKNITVVSIGPRLVARLLDTVLIGFLSMMVAAAAGIFAGMLGMYSSDAIPIFTVIGGLLFSLAYYVLAWSNSGQTLGDTLLGIKIVTAEGSPPSLGQAILRYVGYIVSALALSIGFIWIAFDKQRQGWHDKIARTYMIPAHQSFSATDRVAFTPADSGSGAIWVAVWIILALFAPGALSAGVWTLGPFVDQALRSILGR